jgi:cytochrome c-type biogenesis protein CcmE
LGFKPIKFRIMKKKFLIGGGVILIAVVYLLYLSFGSSVSYYVTVSEFFDRSDELHDTNIRVAGKIADASIEWNAADLELIFTITEGDESLPVIYHGAQPSGFKEGSNILVEGKYNSNGTFRASQLILKCPSKYESIE